MSIKTHKIVNNDVSLELLSNKLLAYPVPVVNTNNIVKQILFLHKEIYGNKVLAIFDNTEFIGYYRYSLPPTHIKDEAHSVSIGEYIKITDQKYDNYHFEFHDRKEIPTPIYFEHLTRNVY